MAIITVNSFGGGVNLLTTVMARWNILSQQHAKRVDLRGLIDQSIESYRFPSSNIDEECCCGWNVELPLDAFLPVEREQRWGEKLYYYAADRTITYTLVFVEGQDDTIHPQMITTHLQRVLYHCVRTRRILLIININNTCLNNKFLYNKHINYELPWD